MNLTIDQKLDLIIQLLQQPQANIKRKQYGYRCEDVKDAVAAWSSANTRTGFMPTAEIASECGLPTDKTTVQAVARLLEDLGHRRTKSGTHRGFRLDGPK